MKNILIRLLVVVLSFTVLTSFSIRQPGFSIQHLRTEYLKNPWGVDVVHPRFSWQLKSSERDIWQKAYQVLVASSRELLQNDKADMWDSHKMDSRNSINIVYSVCKKTT